MSTRRERKKKKLLLFFISCIVFGIGYYILNVVSKIYEVPLGLTFHVVFGCTLMAISGIYIGYTTKQLLFPKKRKRTKRVYLDENSDENSK
ncbi:hypothetical protein [Flavobacterium sp.]|jgi:hypothetical protein|uniref:hypothetical protein n=1 Tax=Flavobacterium sp. TaxID=239 RepID=UPI0037C0D529